VFNVKALNAGQAATQSGDRPLYQMGTSNSHPEQCATRNARVKQVGVELSWQAVAG